MESKKEKKQIAIIGGGPSGLFIYKRLVAAGVQIFEITIFEKNNSWGRACHTVPMVPIRNISPMFPTMKYLQ